MNTALCVVIVVIILLILIWIFYSNTSLKDRYDNVVTSGRKTYDNYFTEPIDLYLKTTGYEFDDTAKMALDKSLKKDSMYTKNELNDNISDVNLDKATTNAFIIADLYRFNVATNQLNPDDANLKAAVYYNKTLRRMNRNPTSIIKQEGAAKITPEFMIYRAEDFYDHNQLDNQIADLRPNFDEIRDNLRNARIAYYTKPPKVNTYYDEKPITNDPQNVHDTQLSNDVKQKYDRLVIKNTKSTGIKPVLADIEAALNVHKFESDQHKERAMTIFNKMSMGYTNTNLGDTETNILLNTWRRIQDPENIKNKESLQQSLFDALTDSMDKDNYGEYHEVCLSGRCNRILQSLTLFDADEEIAQPVKTVEIVRNEVFTKSHQIIQEQLKKQTPEIIDMYNGKITIDTAKLKAFEENVKNEIERTIRQDYTNVKSDVLETLILDAKAGV